MTTPITRGRFMARFISAALLAAGAALTGLSVAPHPARAEVSEVRLARQFGVVYAPILIMENQKLIEKHAAAKGMPDLKVVWTQFAGPAVMNDAILSSSIDFTAQGLPSLAVLWDKTRNNIGVKGVAAINDSPVYLNTRNPNIKSIKDFTDKDRIALTSVKVSIQAIYLQIAAEKAFGVGKHTQLDHLTVGIPHPEAMAAVIGGNSELTSHFVGEPFHTNEMKAGLRTVLNSYDVMGGPSTVIAFCSTEKFRAENPKVFDVVAAAYHEALAFINADLRRTAKIYLEMSRDKKTSEDDLTASISAPEFKFSATPKTVGTLTGFMHRVGTLKNKADSWKDLFFKEAHGLPGN
jgi:NitT/TauT family transport system substrate-binding protein